jgi:hemerythrin
MPLEWTPALQTDVPEIDEQHQELFRRIALFSAAIAENKGDAEIGKMVEFMAEYAELHLSTEEKLLQQHSFPQLAVHKAQHDYYRRNIAAIKQQLATAADQQELVDKVYQILTLWLINHIKKMDLIWAAYLKSKPSTP